MPSNPFQVFKTPNVKASAAVLPCVVIYRTGENTAATATTKASHRPLGVSAEFTKYQPISYISNVNHADTGDPITYFSEGSQAQVRVGAVALTANAELSFNSDGEAIAAGSGDWVIGTANHAAPADGKVEVALKFYVKA